MQRTAIFSTCYSHTDYCLCLKWGRVCHCEPTPRGGDLWTLCCWRKKAASLACPRESAASRAKAVEDAFSLRAACTGSAPAEKPAAERQKVEEDEWEPIPDAVELYLSKKGGLVSSAVVSSLAEQPRFIKLLEQARELTPQAVAASGEELALIEECNQLVIDIDTDILAVHRFIRDIYSMKFPELESIVQAPLEYIAVVHRIQNQTDLTQVDLSDLLPSPMIMALTVAASLSISGSAGSNAANAGRRLPEEDLEKAITAAKEALALAERRKEVLQYLESRMSLVAPNVSAILGAALTARLLTKVGCLQSLAKMPAQNIMEESAAEALLNAADSSENPGAVGRALREGIVQALMKAQEPPPAPMKKALPAPDERSKPKRGGKRHRRLKEKQELSEVQKQLNRMKFGEQEDTVGLKGRWWVGGGGGCWSAFSSANGKGETARGVRSKGNEKRRREGDLPARAETENMVAVECHTLLYGALCL
ncbi:snoRNA binding domain-containing protein [Cyclospora cayetanensis]|uniref:SnoRNA binding domain-containing protein n=1 Tax=Cyclospora cayetanensis TaxID=88456 RepID=A0A1D3D4N1_9EIME|nr:snoRNA binding domain-containing protein [Cyclospora cayetanensis]